VPEKIKLQTIQIDDWVLRCRLPIDDAPHPIILLLHGWTGDENTMWVFAPHLPADVILIAPRAPHPASQGGYSWRIFEPGQPRPTIDDFRPAADALMALITAWPLSFPGISDDLRLIGFSQGAALAFTFAILHPERVRACASLAGFIPQLLQGAGADITYCEADVGHKLSLDCFRGLDVFFRSRP